MMKLQLLKQKKDQLLNQMNHQKKYKKKVCVDHSWAHYALFEIANNLIIE